MLLSVGHEAALPVQKTLTSHAVVALRQTVPVDLNISDGVKSDGHEALLPEHWTFLSHTSVAV
jgi:hypothetical protein